MSSESSIADCSGPLFDQRAPAVFFDFEQFLESNYQQAYNYFEAAAKARHHVVNAYNFNPSNKWHNMYLQNQQ